MTKVFLWALRRVYLMILLVPVACASTYPAPDTPAAQDAGLYEIHRGASSLLDACIKVAKHRLATSSEYRDAEGAKNAANLARHCNNILIPIADGLRAESLNQTVPTPCLAATYVATMEEIRPLFLHYQIRLSKEALYAEQHAKYLASALTSETYCDPKSPTTTAKMTVPPLPSEDDMTVPDGWEERGAGR